VLRASCTVGLPPASVYQPTTTSSPAAATEGPLTGQPGITQPSACTGTGSAQALPS
jgi:hypothetical protein